MPVRHTNLGSTIGSLIAAVLSVADCCSQLIGNISPQRRRQSDRRNLRNPALRKNSLRGKYIVEGLAGCGYCHTPRDENGEIDRTKWLAGAPVFYQPGQPVSGWPTTAPRIAGLPPGSNAEMITLLTTSVSRTGRPLRAPMPSFRMTRTDAEAVVAYVKSLSPGQ
jgi:mono/diheme cytochrome c family protein